MDIFEQARRSVKSSLIERYFGKPKSYWEKGEFWTLNPLRNDTKIGSFSISESGFYSDFASGQEHHKGDFIKLVSEHFGIKPKEAAEKIIQDSGGIVSDNENRTNNANNAKYEPKKKEKKPKIGILIDKVKALKYQEKFLQFIKSDYNTKDKTAEDWKAIASYKYYEYGSENILFYVIRYESQELKRQYLEETENGIESKIKFKKFKPFHLNEKELVRLGLPTNFTPYSLYNINQIIGNDLPIILVEGEKCANIKVDGYVLVTYHGGVNGLKNFDFSPLKKRQVYIFPDNDKQKYKDDHEKAGEIIPLHLQPGQMSALKIQDKLLKNAKILDISKLDKPEKWDIADAAAENLDLVELIESLKPIEKEIPLENELIEFDPEFAADLFLQERYDGNSLEQLDGVFWRYLKNRFYWERIDFSNIKSDIQIFLRDRGFFEYAKSLDKSKDSFKRQVTSFIKDFAQGYFENNPFKESAISPYIHIKNGVIHIKDYGYEFISRNKKDEEFFKKLHPVNCFDFEYDPKFEGKINYLNLGKYAPTFDYYVKSIVPENSLDDQEIIMTLKFVCQMIAYCMSPLKKRPYFFSFYGDEDTAKSSLFYLVREFVGEKFTINRSVAELKTQFSASDLWGAKLFVDEDMEENEMLPGAFIKKYSGGQSITVERKHENAIHGVKISVAMFFVSNYKLKAYGIEGLKKRAIIAKFENKVPKNPDSDLMQRISGKKPHNELTPGYEGKTFDERSYILHLIMKEWVEMSENSYHISTPSWIKTSTNNLLSEMTSSSEYLKDAASGYRTTVEPGIIYTIDEIFKDYSEWCKEQGRKPKGKNKFEEEIRRDKERLESARTSKRRKGMYKLLHYDDFEDEKEDIDEDGEIPFE